MQPLNNYEIDFIKVGKRIKQARIEKRLSQAELGEILGCSNNHMSHVEVGQTKPSLPMMLKLSIALDKSLDYFFLDTPYAKCEKIIETDLAEKLNQCDATTLCTVGKFIDTLLEHNKLYSKNCEPN